MATDQKLQTRLGGCLAQLFQCTDGTLEWIEFGGTKWNAFASDPINEEKT